MKRHRATSAWSAFLLAFSLILSPGLAQKLKVELKSYRVVLTKGEHGLVLEKLLPGVQAPPGEVILYRLVAKNEGEEPARYVQLVIPVPEHTTYVPGSACPLKIGPDVLVPPQFSTNGEDFTLTPVLKDEEGNELAITHVAWVVPELAPGAEVEVSIKVKVR